MLNAFCLYLKKKKKTFCINAHCKHTFNRIKKDYNYDTKDKKAIIASYYIKKL